MTAIDIDNTTTSTANTAVDTHSLIVVDVAQTLFRSPSIISAHFGALSKGKEEKMLANYLGMKKKVGTRWDNGTTHPLR